MKVKIICLQCGTRFAVSILKKLVCSSPECRNTYQDRFAVAENQTIEV